MNNPILNIAAYKFIQLSNLPNLQLALKEKALEYGIKGTILISEEGINLILAGDKEAINAFQRYLNEFSEFQNITYKESLSETVPFDKIRVRIKPEIIRMNVATIQPERQTAPYVSPHELKSWYDEKRDMVILDARNDYEVAVGGFEAAVDLKINKFREFPEALKQLPHALKTKTIVTFCTGGIRCEKAAEYMRQQGFENVYQLEGGILNYFEKVGKDHYQGDCFVFDHRVIIDHKLKETGFRQCLSCREKALSERESLAQCEFCQHIRDSGRPTTDTEMG